jgi:formate dehydrogenase iron-sulfur subunit
VSLLLAERAKRGDSLVRLTADGPACAIGTDAAVMPERRPVAGEQYRFHFDMTRCIGCRCCEVACSEQNGNPIEINWRRVGEIEGGTYPFTQRLYLSMSCNHCLEPSCLKGCPVNAYTKDSVTGIVRHSADTCIGCAYCTWNCPYGAPQYNPARGVVGKCDLCYHRLEQGRAPACADACPEGAIRIELVNIGEWRRDHSDADAPGMPAAGHTISTTRVTLPEKAAPVFERADHHRVRPEDPHLPLVFMLVLTQLCAGAFVYLSFLPGGNGRGVVASLLLALVSLGASSLHLGRPAFAWRALKMWRRSWLSREVLLFSLFAGAAAASVLLPSAAFAAGALGLAGVTASAFIYLVPARPAWNSARTVADFHLTGLLLGPLYLAALGIRVPMLAIAVAGAAQLLNQLLKLAALAASDEFELRASARLLTNDLRGLFLLRAALLVVGGIVLPLVGHAAIAFALALAGELLSRYLFFVSVVPKSVADTFIGRRAA